MSPFQVVVVVVVAKKKKALKKKKKNKKKRRVILYFHGGAFALCTPKTHRALLSKLCKYTNGADILCPNYRRPPEHPWPTPIDDCV